MFHAVFDSKIYLFFVTFLFLKSYGEKNMDFWTKTVCFFNNNLIVLEFQIILKYLYGDELFGLKGISKNYSLKGTFKNFGKKLFLFDFNRF
jgi:hypothetical protein